MGPDKRISTMPTSSPGDSLTQGKMAVVRVSRARLGKLEWRMEWIADERPR